MLTKKSVVPPEVFQLKVTLLGTMPPIWRRLLVPAGLTLAQLHDVLQAAMGWQDCHARIQRRPPAFWKAQSGRPAHGNAAGRK